MKKFMLNILAKLRGQHVYHVCAYANFPRENIYQGYIIASSSAAASKNIKAKYGLGEHTTLVIAG